MILTRGTEECSLFWLPIFSCDWKIFWMEANTLQDSGVATGGMVSEVGWEAGLAFHFASAMFSLGTTGRAKGLENEIHRELCAGKCDKHQQKERSHLRN